MHLGFRPSIDSDRDMGVVGTLLDQDFVPKELTTRVRVSMTVAKYTPLLLQTSEVSTALSLVGLMDRELDAQMAACQGGTRGSTDVKLDILLAKLHAHTLPLTAFTLDPMSHGIKLQTALDVALGIITLGATFDGPALPRVDPIWAHNLRIVPKNHIRGISFATIFLLRFFHPSGTASQPDKDAAAFHIARAGGSIHRLSNSPWHEYKSLSMAILCLARVGPNCDKIGMHTQKWMRVPMNDQQHAWGVGVGDDGGTYVVGDLLRDFWGEPSIGMLHMEYITALPTHDWIADFLSSDHPRGRGR